MCFKPLRENGADSILDLGLLEAPEKSQVSSSSVSSLYCLTNRITNSTAVYKNGKCPDSTNKVILTH